MTIPGRPTQDHPRTTQGPPEYPPRISSGPPPDYSMNPPRILPEPSLNPPLDPLVPPGGRRMMRDPPPRSEDDQPKTTKPGPPQDYPRTTRVPPEDFLRTPLEYSPPRILPEPSLNPPLDPLLHAQKMSNPGRPTQDRPRFTPGPPEYHPRISSGPPPEYSMSVGSPGAPGGKADDARSSSTL